MTDDQLGEAYADGYDFISGCAGTIITWGLKDTGKMTQPEIETVAEELGLDPAMFGNIDASASFLRVSVWRPQLRENRPLL